MGKEACYHLQKLGLGIFSLKRQQAITGRKANERSLEPLRTGSGGVLGGEVLVWADQGGVRDSLEQRRRVVGRLRIPDTEIVMDLF